PDAGVAWYFVANDAASIVTRTGTDSRSGLMKIFVGSASPYPSAGGTAIVRVSPIASPWIPVSNPGTTPPLPIVTERGAYEACQANMKAFGYEALSRAMDCRLVSNTSPFSTKVPTQPTRTWSPPSTSHGGTASVGEARREHTRPTAESSTARARKNQGEGTRASA